MNLGVQVVKEGREGIEMVGFGPQAREHERRRQTIWNEGGMVLQRDSDSLRWRHGTVGGVSDQRVMGIHQSG